MKHPDDRDTELDRTPPDGVGARPHDLRTLAESGAARDDDSMAGQKKPFDPYRFAATTMPPGLRAKLLAARLPVVPQEQLENTAPPGHAAPLPEPTRPLAAPPDSSDRTDPARWVQHRKRNRVFVAAAIVALLLALGILVVRGQGQEEIAPGATAAPPVAEQVEHRSAAPDTAAPPPKTTNVVDLDTLPSSPAPDPTNPVAASRAPDTRRMSAGAGSAAVIKPEKTEPPVPPGTTASAASSSGSPLDRLIVAPEKE